MRSQRLTPHQLVARLGPHPATRLGLDLDGEDDAALGAWLLASVLLGGRTQERIALAAFEALRADALATPEAVASAGFAALHARLEGAKVPRSDSVAAVVGRVCGALVRDWAGSVDRMAASADGLDELAGRLSQLGAGFGGSGVMRFLVPLRGRWTVANDLPSSAAVAAAAADLGILSDRDDLEGAATRVARFARGDAGNETGPGRVPARDLEAALERLGRTACLRERPDRCPLAGECSRREPEMQ